MLLLLECAFGYVCGLLINDALSHQALAPLVVVTLYVARYIVSVLAGTWLGAASMPAS